MTEEKELVSDEERGAGWVTLTRRFEQNGAVTCTPEYYWCGTITRISEAMSSRGKPISRILLSDGCTDLVDEDEATVRERCTQAHVDWRVRIEEHHLRPPREPLHEAGLEWKFRALTAEKTADNLRNQVEVLLELLGERVA